MLQVFYIDVAKVDWDVALVASVSDVCCKRLFKNFLLFQKYVANVLSGYCIYFSGYTHMLQESIQNISFVLDLYCLSRCCISCSGYTHVANHVFQMFHLFQTYVAEVIHVATLTGAGSGHMRRRSRMRAASKVIVGSPYLHALPQTPTRNNMRTLMRRRAGMCSSGSRMRGRRSRWGRREHTHAGAGRHVQQWQQHAGQA
jgi:hypothetical protein